MAGKKYVADFETTVFVDQKYTEVWSAAITEIGNDDESKVEVFHRIDSFMLYLKHMKSPTVMFHNLKFDGEFIVSWLLSNGFKFAHDKKPQDLVYGEFTTLISGMGQWYNIKVMSDTLITFADSLKLLPFSVSAIGKAFKTKHQKLEMEYTGYRYAGCAITEGEMKYIKNDVLVMSEALDIFLKEGHKKSTIGSCCLEEYKATQDIFDLEMIKPLTEYELDETKFGASTYDAYIRKSYRGGWCYGKPDELGKLQGNGFVLDVNSLYPSVMHSCSGSYYPVGIPKILKVDHIPDSLMTTANKYWFVRFTCRFKIKEGYLPFVQIKHSPFYKGTESLATSDYFFNGEWHNSYIDDDGNEVELKPELTMTCIDFKLFLEHYQVYNLTIKDMAIFETRTGLFDDYIDKWIEIKKNSSGATRTIAKLFLNNLYGKMATNSRCTNKVPYVEDGVVNYLINVTDDKTAGYIPIGSAITSWARNFTIRAAQKNYDRFIYSDTDSLHCKGDVSEAVGIKLDDGDLCCWKHESDFTEALFVRQKTYIEKTSDGYAVTCAGMPKRCKNLFLASMGVIEVDPKTEKEKEFLSVKRTMQDFKQGLNIPSKLLPKRIKGGVVLLDSTFEMR